MGKLFPPYSLPFPVSTVRRLVQPEENGVPLSSKLHLPPVNHGMVDGRMILRDILVLTPEPRNVTLCGKKTLKI